LRAAGNGLNIVSTVHGEGSVDWQWRRLRLNEEERGRGLGGLAWAERPSGAGRFKGKGAHDTRRMGAEM
jgi:hypothetical protein